MSQFTSSGKVSQGYLLGVDVGNTKTHALITDFSGQVIGFGNSGCGNYEAIGVDGFREIIYSVTNEALQSAQIDQKIITGMGFGLAGYDWPAENQIMIQAIDSLGISCPYRFVNDAVIGLIAGSTEGWGVAVDAGTGNNVRGRDQSGKMGRITGNSIRFGEIGGAGELVWRAMVAVTYAWTKRGPKTELTNMMMAYTDIPDEAALIEALAMDKVHLPAILALEIFDLARKGEQVANETIIYSAQELARNTNAVIRQLNFQDIPFEIVLIGSVFKAGEIYIQPFREVIHEFAPQASLVHLKNPPVIGSILLAAEAIGQDLPELRHTLVQSKGWLSD